MDLTRFIFAAGWVFFIVWGIALAAVGVIAFGRDIRPATQHTTTPNERR